MAMQLNNYQDEFIFSESRFCCLLTGVGSGKTFCLIAAATEHCKNNPGALALIVRKEFTDLRDSTIKDFNFYNNAKVPDTGNANFLFSNGSEILFRHGNVNDLSVLKNINLSFAGIEQGEEYDNAEVFDFLRDRLRRKQTETRRMVVIANSNGHNWLWDIFINKAQEMKDFSQQVQVLDSFESTGEYYYKRTEKVKGHEQVYECWTANSFVNAHNLPQDTLIDWCSMKENAPNHYKRMILNSFEDFDDDDTVFSSSDIETALTAEFLWNKSLFTKRIIACDIARYGDDSCCMVLLEQRGPMHWEMALCEQWRHKDLMYSTGKIMALRQDYRPDILVIDGEGMGGGVVDRIKENGIPVVEYRGGFTKTLKHPDKYANKNAEDAFFMKEQLIQNGRLKILPDVVSEAQTIRYKYLSNGKKTLVSKEQMRKDGIKSPNIYDALRMACSVVDTAQAGGFKAKASQPAYSVKQSAWARVR